MLVEVIKERLPYGHKYYDVGERFEMRDEHVKLLTTVGRVKAVVAESAPPRRRRTYRRRDMRAEVQPAEIVRQVNVKPYEGDTAEGSCVLGAAAAQPDEDI